MRPLALTLALLLLVGCTVDKKDPRTKHEPGLVDRVARGYEQGPAPDEPDERADFFGLDLSALYRASQARPADRVAATVSPLAGLFLDQERLASTAFQNHRRVTWALSFFNNEILLAAHEGRDLSALLPTYAALALAGCDVATLTGCRNLPLFRRDPQTSAVLKLAARQTRDLRLYYNLLKVASDLVGQPGDPELASLSYARMIELFKTYLDVGRDGDYTRLTVKKGLSARQKSDFNMWVAFEAGLLATSASARDDAAQTVEFFDWFSSRQMEAIFGQAFTAQITRRLAARLADPVIWNKFVDVFRREARDFDLSYANALRRVSAYDPSLLGRLGVARYDMDADVKSRSKDLATLLFLNRLMELRPLSRELYLYQFSGTSPERTVDMIEAMVKVSLVERIMQTGKLMAARYRWAQENGLANRDLMDEILRYSERTLTPMWSDYINRIEQVQFFFNEYVKRRYAAEHDTPLAAKIARVDALLVEFNGTVQYMATYPNMLMLGYYAAKTNLQMKFKTFFGSEVNINRDVILHDLMTARVPSMFLFTKFKDSEGYRDRQAIDSVKMMWALNFAMTLDLPKLYGIPLTDFLGRFFGVYNQPTNRRMRETSEAQRASLLPGGAADKMFEICAADPSRPLLDRQISLDTVGSQLFLGQLSSGGMGSAQPPLRGALDLVAFTDGTRSRSLPESIETLRTDVDPKLRQMYLVRSVFASAPHPDQAALAMLDGQMAETLNLRKVVLNSTRRLVNDLPDCLLKVQGLERERQLELIDMESDYLRLAAAAYRIAVESPTEAEAFARLKASADFADIDASRPLTEALNALFAARLGFDGRPFAEIQGYRQDYFANAGFQRARGGRVIYNYRATELYLRLAGYLTRGFNGREVRVKLDRLHLDMPLNVSQLSQRAPTTGPRQFNILSPDLARFRAAAMVGFRFAMRNWFAQQSGLTHFYRSVLMARSALFKFDFLGDLDLQRTVACDERCQAARDENMRGRLTALLDFNRRALVDLSLTPRDVDVLGLFDSFSYFNIDNGDEVNNEGPVGLFIRHDMVGTYIGFADDLFSYLTSIMLGAKPVFLELRKWADQDVWGAKLENENNRFTVTAEEMMVRYDYFQRASVYYRTILEKDRLLPFRIDESIDRQILLFHTQKLTADFQIAEMFQDVLGEWSQAHDPLPPAFFSIRRGPIQLAPITAGLLSLYRQKMDAFHDSTEHVFEKRSSTF